MTPGQIVGVVLGCLAFVFFVYTIVLGCVMYSMTLKRNAIIGKLSRKNFAKNLDKYGVDYSWFDSVRKEKIIIENNGTKLCGFLIRTQKVSDKIAILNHGYFQDHKDMQPFAEFFLSKGYNVLMPDARACGESDGDVIGMGYLDRLDIKKWVETTINIFGNKCQIILFGVSMGGAAVCMSAAELLPSNVKCVIADSAYDSAYSQFAYVLRKRTLLREFPVIKIANKCAKLFGKYSLREASTIKHVAKSKLPILFIHGSKDGFVPAYMSHNLFHTLRPEMREIYISNGSDHMTSYHDNPKEYSEIVDKWLDRWVK